MNDRHLCWPPNFFFGPAVAPYFFILESTLAITPEPIGLESQ